MTKEEKKDTWELDEEDNDLEEIIEEETEEIKEDVEPPSQEDVLVQTLPLTQGAAPALERVLEEEQESQQRYIDEGMISLGQKEEEQGPLSYTTSGGQTGGYITYGTSGQGETYQTNVTFSLDEKDDLRKKDRAENVRYLDFESDLKNRDTKYMQSKYKA